MQREGHCMTANMPDTAGPSMTAFVVTNKPILKPLFRALPMRHNRKNITSEATEVDMIIGYVNDLLDFGLNQLWTHTAP